MAKNTPRSQRCIDPREDPRERKIADDWNAKYPIGTLVVVKRDRGDFTTTRTRSEARVLSGHSAVVFLEGISPCYSLRNVSPIDESELKQALDREVNAQCPK